MQYYHYHHTCDVLSVTSSSCMNNVIAVSGLSDTGRILKKKEYIEKTYYIAFQ